MVLEAGDHARPGAEVGLDRAVADQARARLADRAQVHEPDAGQLLAAELVASGRAAGSRRTRRARRRRGPRPRGARRAWSATMSSRHRRPGRGPGRRPCRRGRARSGSKRLAEAGRRRARSRARATRSARAARRCCRGRRRCSSAPDRASRTLSAGTSPPCCRSGRAVVGISRPAGRLEPRGARLGLEPVRAHDSRTRSLAMLDSISPLGDTAWRWRSTTSPSSSTATDDRLAREDPAVALEHVGERRGRRCRP